MDPVSAFGVFTGAIQVAQVIGQTIAGLSTLRGKYQNADITIRSMISELSTIKSAITQLHDLSTYNADSSHSSHREYDDGIAVAIDGCWAIMEVLSDKVTELVNDNANRPTDSTMLTFKTRVKVMWNEGLMSNLQIRLSSQIRALNLLLQACQCRSSTEQLQLLRKVDSQNIIKQVADDTATLRSTLDSATASQVDTLSNSGRQLSSVGETEFGFDDALLATPTYQRQSYSRQTRQRPVGLGVSSEVHRSLSNNTSSDEGYVSHSLTPNHSISPISSNASSYKSRQFVGPNDAIIPTHNRSKSVTFGTQPNHSPPGFRRWVSTNESSTLTSPVGSKREKIFSALKRLNTTSRASLKSPLSPNVTVSPSLGPTRGRRGRESDFTTSIDLTTQNGRTAPDIVKAAQSGARYDVERLLGSGHNIEDFHLHTRRTALMVSAHCGKEDIVDLLIQNNAKLHRADLSGSTALHLAASRGHVDVVALLLMEAIDIEAKTKLGRTALWVSATNGHLQTTQMLLEYRAKVNTRADNQMTALHVAARNGDVELAGILVTYGADVDARDASMMTALHYACEGGHLGVIEFLLNAKANIDGTGVERKTPLICAAAAGELLAVQLLVKRKSNLKCSDEGGMTALHWAAFNGHVEIVSFLAGQSRNSLAWTNGQGRTPLHLAAMKSQFGVVEFLIRKDCPLETRCLSGFNPLHYACAADSIDIVRLLLTSGADIESQTDKTQQRAIHISAAGCSISLIRHLCERNASLEARDATGDRALCVAARNGHVAAVQTLLDFGSPMHMRFSVRSHEDSPLCLAAQGGHLPVVSLLLSRGASVLSKDEMGWQPIRYAAYHGHPDVLEALIRADPSTALNWDESFSPDCYGFSPDRIAFAPDPSISAGRKRRVIELLDRFQKPQITSSRHQDSITTGSNEVNINNFPPSTTSYYEPSKETAPFTFSTPVATTFAHDSVPSELPGTLEQGLPSSRSATPTHMRGGTQGDNASVSVIQEETSENRGPASPVQEHHGEYESIDSYQQYQPPEPQPQPQIVSPSPSRPPGTSMALTQSLSQLTLDPDCPPVSELEGDNEQPSLTRQEYDASPSVSSTMSHIAGPLDVRWPTFS